MFQVDILKLFKTQRERLDNFAIILLSNIFTAGIGFLTTIKIANIFGSEKFGELAYAIAIGSILATNIRFGMDRSLIRDLVHFPERFNEMLIASLFARGLMLFVCIACLLALMALPIAGVTLSRGMFLVILATSLAPLQIANVFDVWECQGRHSLYLCAERGLYFVMIWGMIIWMPEGVTIDWIGISLLASLIVFIGLQYQYAWSRLKPTFHAIPIIQITRTAFSLLVSNKWLWMAAIAALGMATLNKVVLKHISGYSELGVFTASMQFVAIGTILLKNIARIGRPILARHTKPDSANINDMYRFLILYLCVGVFFASIVALPAIVVPGLILEFFFIPEYSSGTWVLRFLGVFLLFCVFDLYLGQYLTLVRKDKSYLTAAVVTGLISLVSCLILVPRFSATGAAIALVVAELFKSGFFIYLTVFHIRKQIAARMY